MLSQVNSDVIRGFDSRTSLSEKPALIGSTNGNTLQEELGGLQNEDQRVGDGFNFSNSDDPRSEQEAALRSYFISYRSQVAEKPVFVSCKMKQSRVMFGEGNNEVSADLFYKLRLKDGSTPNLRVKASQPYPHEKNDWAIAGMTVSQGKLSTD